MQKHWMLAAALVPLLAACGEEPPPMTMRDGGRIRRDATVVLPDAGPAVDAGRDAGRRDAGFDAGRDAGRRDTGTPGFDSGPGDGGTFPSLCGPVGGTPCGAGCGPGEICLENGCGDDRCVPSGNPCTAEQHCHASSNCVNDVCSGVTPGVTCNDSRDCPTGFSCDSNSCVDRRIACAPDGSFPCPQGFTCYEDGVTHPFCRRMHLPCTPLGGDVDGVSAGCMDDGQCGNVSGAGNVCFSAAPVTACEQRTSCTFALGGVCGVNPLDGENSCGRFGLCRPGMSDCASTFVCLDLWGDGASECVPALGMCDEASECAPGSACAAPWYWGPPRCIESPIPFD